MTGQTAKFNMPDIVGACPGTSLPPAGKISLMSSAHVWGSVDVILDLGPSFSDLVPLPSIFDLTSYEPLANSIISQARIPHGRSV